MVVMKNKLSFNLSGEQKKVFLALCLIGILYFCIFLYPNYHKGESASGWSLFSQDEYVVYPVLMKMMANVSNITHFWGDLVNQFYPYYGFPYSFFSVLVLLPARLILGETFDSSAQLNIFLLRQFINVIPIILAAGGLVFFQTRFKGFWRSIILFVFLLSIPEIFRSNIRWWHPDSLCLLSIALTFAFLLKDNYRLNTWFYLSAIACGMAISTKLYGVFFFLTIPVYLWLVWLKQKKDLKKILYAGLVFLLIMSLTFIISSPFLFYKVPREQWLRIQFSKSGDIDTGYLQGDPYYYQKGLIYWQWTVESRYGQPWFIAFLLCSVLIGCFWGKNILQNRLLLAWLIPLGMYLVFFVAPKPSHYISPFMLPLFSAALTLFDVIPLWVRQKNNFGNVLRKVFIILLVLIIAQQFVFHLQTDFSLLTTIEYF
jgi:hypothetical protein